MIEAHARRPGPRSTVPPKRTPPNMAKPARRSSSSRMTLRKVLSQRTVMPYSATPPKPAMTRSSRGSRNSSQSRIGRKGDARAVGRDAGEGRVQRLDLEAVDGDHRVAFVQQVVRQRVAGRAEAGDEHLTAARGARQEAAQLQRIPAGQQAVDLEAPGQLQHVLQDAGLGLGNVDRLLLLIDAGLHAVVADAVAGAGDHGVVDGGDGERRDRRGRRAWPRASPRSSLPAGQPARLTSKSAFLEAAVAVLQALGAGVLALVMAEDAVVHVVEGLGQVHAGVGEGEAVAAAAAAPPAALAPKRRRSPFPPARSGWRGSSLWGCLKSTPAPWRA